MLFQGGTFLLCEKNAWNNYIMGQLNPCQAGYEHNYSLVKVTYMYTEFNEKTIYCGCPKNCLWFFCYPQNSFDWLIRKWLKILSYFFLTGAMLYIIIACFDWQYLMVIYMANGKFLKLLYQHETYLYNEPCPGRMVGFGFVKFGYIYFLTDFLSSLMVHYHLERVIGYM